MSSGDSPVAQALSTDVVLLHVFKYLGVKDLLDCRLFNHKWQTIASEALYSRQCYIDYRKLLAIFDNQGLSWVGVYQLYASNLRFLADRICNNPDFRFLGFVFHSQMLHDDRHTDPPLRWWESFQEFGKTCGKHIRRLRIEESVATYRLPEILAALSEVEHVTAKFVSHKTTLRGEDARFLRFNGEDITLPRLRRLTAMSFHNWFLDEMEEYTLQPLEELIKGSPELKRIEGFDTILTDAALKAGKLNTVSHLDLRFPRISHTQLPHLKRFSENCPPLKSFSFRGFLDWMERDLSDYTDAHERREFLDLTWGSLNRILISSKDTLKYLRMDYLETPVKLAKLSTLHMMDRREPQPYRIFPREWAYSPSSYFPALKTVRLQLETCKGDSVRTYFGEPQDDTFPTVTTLELECPFDDVGIQALGNTFPNVKTLRVFWGKKIGESYLNDLWLFSPTLKNLDIQDFGVEEFVDFDWCVTGFYEEICENLRKRHRIPYDPSSLDAFRSYDSILKLRGLEKFSVHFVCKELEKVSLPNSVLSPISHWYAFDLMPNLKAEFVYDFKGKNADVIAKVLEPYKRYLSILPR